MITLLMSHGIATKTWQANGTVDKFTAGYEYRVQTAPAESLEALSALLLSIQSHPYIMAIRGTYRGDDHARTVLKINKRTGKLEPGLTSNGLPRRILENFDDAPLPWMMIDIDEYAPPAGINPVLEPERAIQAYIGANLPPEFYGAGYHWQLSSGAGHADNIGLLKAHVWFWLDQPRTSAELLAWHAGYDPTGEKIDGRLFNVIQAHYTALPVFALGAVDPVPTRAGFVRGGVVALRLDAEAMQRAATRDNDGRYDVADPRAKPGAIGAFCRTYTIEQLIAGPLAEHFAFERGSEWRMTWLKSRSAAEGGAFVTEDRLHVVCTHATDPCRNRKTNLFDLVRVHCFGAADAGADWMQLKQMRTTPSQQAMLDYAMRCEPVRDAVAAENAARMTVPEAPVVAAVPVATDAGNAVSQPTITTIVEETLLFPAAQVAYFANCVYVASIHRILTPDGETYDQQRFNAIYGGRSFVMDPTNARTVRSAWECFLESQALTFPKVCGRLFRPELPAYSIIKMEGASFVNTYVPIETRQIQGDPRPFLRLLQLLLPDERDRNILLTYMASMLRNPGVKFQWWPVIQGTEGNGKSALFHIMTHCVGHRYTEELNVAEMAKNGIKFNSWIVGTLLLIMEEIYVENRRHFLEEFKPTVTNKRIAVEQKGVDKTTEDNRANGMMGTNHQDGVPITTDSRRYAIFYTAQQKAEDKLRDGMTPAYFADLYDWLDGVGKYAQGGAAYGCAVVNWWLRTQYVLVEEFDPARACQVAPKTSSSAAAIKNSMGPIEQDILEAIESDQEGFRGGWISSIALDRLFEKGHRTLARNKRRGLLQALGYDWHPHLRDGRTTHGNPLKGHPGKFNLYCKLNSEISEITDNAKIMERYFTDQRL